VSQRRRQRNGPRPSSVFDTGLQHERTSLAWERTSISMMVGGMAQVTFGAVLLVWSGLHYEDLHGPLRNGTDVVHPSAARWIGLATIAGTGAGLVAAVVVALTP
jgi:uncharacterized membrane protein YidH (DUF202 family)